jgi:hypothetical protein
MRRLETEIATRANPRERIMLEVYRDHWIAEVRNDVAAVMRTIPVGTVSYRFDGHRLFFSDYIAFGTADEARALY